jgi:hypothetical protein
MAQPPVYLSPFETIVGVGWRRIGGWFVVIKVVAEYNEGDPVPKATVTLHNSRDDKVVYSSETTTEITGEPGPGSSIYFVYLPKQTTTIGSNDWASVLIPCFGYANYHPNAYNYEVGFDSAADAWNGRDTGKPNDLFSDFFLKHPLCIYSELDPTFTEAGLAGIPKNVAFDATMATAVAGYFSSVVANSWNDAPPTWDINPDTGCASTIYPHEPQHYNSVWTVGSPPGPGPGLKQFRYEFTQMLQVRSPSPISAFSFTLENTAGDVEVYDTAGHTVAAPISPSNDAIQSEHVEAGEWDGTLQLPIPPDTHPLTISGTPSGGGGGPPH